MNQAKENKAFVLDYFNAVSGIEKTRESLAQWVLDPVLIEHKLFFESAFPKYEVFAEEMTSEGNRVVVRTRMKGRHEGQFGDIMPSYRDVDFTFIISYTIENQKIVSHWLVADQMVLLEQLGVVPALA
jgi:predicted ester cyclase